MPVIYIPRVFGGTLIINIGLPSNATILVIAQFRNGSTQGTFRDGQAMGEYR